MAVLQLAEGVTIEVDSDFRGEGADAVPIAIVYLTTSFDAAVLGGFALPGADVSFAAGSTVEARAIGELDEDQVRIVVGQLLQAVQPLSEEERAREVERVRARDAAADLSASGTPIVSEDP